MLSCPRCPVVKCVRHRGDDVCCSEVFGTLIGVFVFSELLMTSTISCPLWSSVYECQRVECAFTSPVRTESGMHLWCTVCSVVVRECAVSRRYINVCNCDMFSVVP